MGVLKTVQGTGDSDANQVLKLDRISIRSHLPTFSLESIRIFRRQPTGIESVVPVPRKPMLMVAVIDALEGQVPVQTSVQALNTLSGYRQRKRNDFKQVVAITW